MTVHTGECDEKQMGRSQAGWDLRPPGLKPCLAVRIPVPA